MIVKEMSLYKTYQQNIGHWDTSIYYITMNYIN